MSANEVEGGAKHRFRQGVVAARALQYENLFLGEVARVEPPVRWKVCTPEVQRGVFHEIEAEREALCRCCLIILRASPQAVDQGLVRHLSAPLCILSERPMLL